jgi:hypothetical protein
MKRVNISMIIICMLLLSFLAVAQEKDENEPEYGWKKSMVGGLNLTQTSFDNWSQGGENSVAWQINFNFNFTNEQEKTSWANSGKVNYGQTKTGDAEARKSIDEIKLESVLTYKHGKYLNPYVAATGETQATAGYRYDPKLKISAFLDPGYFRESAGLGYKPSEIIQTRLGVALKQTVTDKYSLRFVGEADKNFKNEVGAESVTDINWKVSENTLLTSKLELFSTLVKFDETDVNWDNVITTKISKYFNVNLNVKLFYDKDISARRQIKQALAFGFAYTFL